MSGLDPTVTGALIAGGAAVLGFAASGWQNNRTIRANRQTSRDERFWDKKTELYEAISAILKAADGEKWMVVPLERPAYDSIEALQRALDEREPAIQLYARDHVADQFHELRRCLRLLYISADKFQSRFVQEVGTHERKLIYAMSRDLQGTRVSRSQIRHRAWVRLARVRRGWLERRRSE